MSLDATRSLLGSLYRYRPRAGKEPLEDFLTEALAHLLRRNDGGRRDQGPICPGRRVAATAKARARPRVESPVISRPANLAPALLLGTLREPSPVLASKLLIRIVGPQPV